MSLAQLRSELMPSWMSYDHESDVLTIHGKKYAAALFGGNGLFSDAGTIFRIERNDGDVVAISRLMFSIPTDPAYAMAIQADALQKASALLGRLMYADQPSAQEIVQVHSEICQAIAEASFAGLAGGLDTSGGKSA